MMYSEDSEEDTEEVDPYRKKYQLIVERCEVIQQDNERLINRFHHTERILRRARKERKFLMDRLDRYGDDWRNVRLPLKLSGPVAPPSQAKTSSPRSSKTVLDKGKRPPSTAKRPKAKVDKNAPKRPANPYFQFCQEQRVAAIEEMASIGQPDPSKVDVTKHLANKWNTLTQDDKKIYYDMYERSKERYAVDMQLYTLSKTNAAATATTTDKF